VFINKAYAETPVASRIEGGNVIYYSALHGAFEAASGVSIDVPDEITLLSDIILNQVLHIPDGIHIQLLPDGNRTIQRGNYLIEYPLIWVSGDSSSLTLGKPGMEHEIIIDGGHGNGFPIFAHAPLIAVSGPDAKLIMYDGVFVQNNYNIGEVPSTSIYQNGGGIFIRTADNLHDRQAEFIMKGGIIRGNTNDVPTPLAVGGGVMSTGFGIFTMEGGAIMDNSARIGGGGVTLGGRGAFRKTGGIIYGSNAPGGYRNTATEGEGSPRFFSHALRIGLSAHPYFYIRSDTITKNEHLSYFGTPEGTGIIGEGDRWDTPQTILFRQRLRIVIIAIVILVLCFIVFMIIRKRSKVTSA